MSILSYTFFQNALLGSLLASILCGLIGTYIVARRLVFISGGITHASFGGIGIGVYLGFSPILSAAVFFRIVRLRHTMVQPPPRHARRFGHRHFLDFRHEHRHHLQFLGTGLHPGAVLLSVRQHIDRDTLGPLFVRHIGTHRHCDFHMLPSSARFHGFRCRIRPFATPSGHHGGISDDGLHRTDYCSLPAYGGHRVGHLPTDHPSSNGQYFHA